MLSIQDFNFGNFMSEVKAYPKCDRWAYLVCPSFSKIFTFTHTAAYCLQQKFAQA